MPLNITKTQSIDGQIETTIVGELPAGDNVIGIVHVDSLPPITGNIIIDSMPAIVGKVSIDVIKMPSALLNNKVIVPTHAIRVPLSSTSVPLYNGVSVKALDSNKGKIFIGNNNVSAAIGYPLIAGQEEVIVIDDLGKIFIDTEIDGDGVTFIGS